MMNSIQMIYPRRLVFGAGCLSKMTDEINLLGFKRLFVISIPALKEKIEKILAPLKKSGISVQYNLDIKSEPDLKGFEAILKEAGDFNADVVIGIGGGSVMDVSKLIAAQMHSSRSLRSVIGTDLIRSRKTYLICAPTTSGTGSEVSPNAIIIDNADGVKKGIISQYLVPDAAYVDPELTVGLPPYVTAFTGMDALTHCIEAYANRFAHPVIDHLALEGIRLIGRNLQIAVVKGNDLEARSKVALGSMYGGMCLGPVNTAAVHALAYPLGSDFKIAHGISNALLLPFVMEYNLTEATVRYAEIAVALGAEKGRSNMETALNGVALIRKLIRDCKLPETLEDIKVPVSAIDGLAISAIQIQRLLKNNVKTLSIDDIVNIYQNAYSYAGSKTR